MQTKDKTDNKKSPSTNAHMFATEIDIPQDSREKTIALLNQCMADTFDLYSQAKQAHWNVKGHDFYQLHLLFDEVAEIVFPFVDALAERITALGGTAKGTARMAAGSSSLEEFPDITGGMQCVQALAERYAAVANSAREGIDKTDELEDMASSDLLTEIVRNTDKALYFLQSHLQEERP